jgi:hypothetical protein
MRNLITLGLAVAVAGSSAAALAADLKSGLPVGKSVPAFQVVKCGGAPNDGVKEGQELCYR